MPETITLFKCEHIGVAGTTDVHVKALPDGRFEARCGIALMGCMNMDEAGFKACNSDPFHDLFYDNYASGNGATEAEALDAMKNDMKSLADSLWAM